MKKHLFILIISIALFSCNEEEEMRTVSISPLSMSFDDIDYLTKTSDYDFTSNNYRLIDKSNTYVLDQLDLNISDSVNFNYHYSKDNANFNYETFNVAIERFFVYDDATLSYQEKLISDYLDININNLFQDNIFILYRESLNENGVISFNFKNVGDFKLELSFTSANDNNIYSSKVRSFVDFSIHVE